MKTKLESSETVQVRRLKSDKFHKVVRTHKKELEQVEIMEYLMKLQEIVPFLPKNKRLSKLEVISNVIDYIHDLRETLGLPACSAIFDTELTPLTHPTSTPDSDSNNVEFSSSPDSLATTTIPPQTHHHHRKTLRIISNPGR